MRWEVAWSTGNTWKLWRSQVCLTWGRKGNVTSLCDNLMVIEKTSGLFSEIQSERVRITFTVCKIKILARYEEKNIMRVVRHQNRLPRKLVTSSALEILKIWLEKHWANWFGLKDAPVFSSAAPNVTSKKLFYYSIFNLYLCTPESGGYFISFSSLGMKLMATNN